jgi:aminopeptidase N
MLGWERFRPALTTYFHRFRFKHPTPDDFFTTISQEAGEDLGWFFEEAYGSSNVFDYAAERLESAPVGLRGFVESTPGAPPEFQETTDPNRFRTTVVVRRIGEARFPIDVLVTFEDGDQVRERWDGQARWQSYFYERSSRAVSVLVDPDRVLLLDVDYTNNSITLRPKSAAAADRWTLKWVVWLQDLLMDYAFFV